MISNETLLKVKERFVDRFAPERIILFGSQARETADDRSDVDILVVCSFKGKRRHLMLEMDRALSGFSRTWPWSSKTLSFNRISRPTMRRKVP